MTKHLLKETWCGMTHQNLKSDWFLTIGNTDVFIGHGRSKQEAWKKMNTPDMLKLITILHLHSMGEDVEELDRDSLQLQSAT